jgi:hypothetical protein
MCSRGQSAWNSVQISHFINIITPYIKTPSSNLLQTFQLEYLHVYKWYKEDSMGNNTELKELQGSDASPHMMQVTVDDCSRGLSLQQQTRIEPSR